MKISEIKKRYVKRLLVRIKNKPGLWVVVGINECNKDKPMVTLQDQHDYTTYVPASELIEVNE